ncbi:hypothetical protein CBL_20398 [Carabus blaptoides fortunei]
MSLKKKIESLRGSRRREKTVYNKIRGLVKVSRADTYISKWFAWDALKFLEDPEEIRTTISNYSEEEVTEDNIENIEAVEAQMSKSKKVMILSPNQELNPVYNEEENIQAFFQICDGLIQDELNPVLVQEGRGQPEIELLVKRVKKIVRALRFKSVELEDEADEIQKKIMCSIDVYAEALQLDFESEDADGLTEADDLPLSGLADVEDLRKISPSVKQKSLKTSTITRWHSVLLMLESVVHKKKAINNMVSKMNKHSIRNVCVAML